MDIPLSIQRGNTQGVCSKPDDKQSVDDKSKRLVINDLGFCKVALCHFRGAAVKALGCHKQRVVVLRDAAPTGILEVDTAAHETVISSVA